MMTRSPRLAAALAGCLALLAGCGMQAVPPQLTVGTTQRPLASSTNPPTIYVLKNDAILYFKPPYGSPGSLPANKDTLLTVNAGNVFLANGDTVREFIGRTQPGPHITLPGPIENFRAAPDGTLLVLVGSSLYAYPKPYVNGHVIDTNVRGSVRLFEMLDNGWLYMIVDDKLFTARRPYHSVQLTTPKLVATGPPGSFHIDRSTGIFYVHRRGFAFPYTAGEGPVWQAEGEPQIFNCDTRRQGGFAVGGNVLIANCDKDRAYVYTPPLTTPIAKYSHFGLALQTVGSDGVVYAVLGYGTNPNIISYAPPYETPATIAKVSGTVRALLVQ